MGAVAEVGGARAGILEQGLSRYLQQHLLGALDLHGRTAPPIPAVTAAPPRDHPILQRWRAAVGPVRFGSASSPASGATGLPGDPGAATSASAATPPGGDPARASHPQPPPPANPADPAAPPTPNWPLTVAAWNTHVGGGALGALWDHLTQGHRPTVLLLQEAFATGPAIPPPAPDAACWPPRIAPDPPGEPRTDIVAFARARGLSLLYVPSMRNGGPQHASTARSGEDPAQSAPAGPDATPREDRGSAILANVPLSSPCAIELPFERQRRVAVTADIRIGYATVALCSLHLDNRAPWGKAWRTLGPARTRQMAGLLRVFPEAADPESTAPRVHILGGDFNTWVRQRREGAWRLARKQFPHPRSPDGRPTHHLEVGGLPRLSDHLMFRLPPGLRSEYRRLESAFGSDHYPLVGKIALAHD